jgi:hypothetical protein
VSPLAVVIIGKFGEHALEVALIDHDDVVEKLGPNRPYDPLGDGVRLRPSWRLASRSL